jgi:hypothetical protein
MFKSIEPLVIIFHYLNLPKDTNSKEIEENYTKIYINNKPNLTWRGYNGKNN